MEQAADPSFVEQAWPYLLTGAFALAGVTVGRWSERRSAHKAWLRDQRLEAYTAFLQGATSVQNLLRDRHYAVGAGAEAKADQAAYRGLDDLSSVSFRIMLLGPDDARTKANEVWQCLWTLLYVEERDPDGAKGDESFADLAATKALDTAENAMVAAAAEVVQNA